MAVTTDDAHCVEEIVSRHLAFAQEMIHPRRKGRGQWPPGHDPDLDQDPCRDCLALLAAWYGLVRAGNTRAELQEPGKLEARQAGKQGECMMQMRALDAGREERQGARGLEGQSSSPSLVGEVILLELCRGVVLVIVEGQGPRLVQNSPREGG